MKRALLIFTALLLVAGPAWGLPEVKNSAVNTIRYQDGVSPSGDTDLFEDTYLTSAAADSGLNHGAADTLRVAGAANTSTFKGGINNILLRFDFLAALPDSAEIRRCRLCMYQLAGYSGALTDTLQISRVVQAWNEGTGGNDGAAQDTSADWNNRTGLAWDTPGANSIAPGFFAREWGATDATEDPDAAEFSGSDSLSAGFSTFYDRTVTNKITFARTGAPLQRNGWICFDITQIARGYQSSAYENNGMHIAVHNNELDHVFPFASSENSNTTIRPFMDIDYLLPQAGGSGGGASGTPLGILRGRGLGLGR